MTLKRKLYLVVEAHFNDPGGNAVVDGAWRVASKQHRRALCFHDLVVVGNNHCSFGGLSLDAVQPHSSAAVGTILRQHVSKKCLYENKIILHLWKDRDFAIQVNTRWLEGRGTNLCANINCDSFCCPLSF
jgi:hypothetical protein